MHRVTNATPEPVNTVCFMDLSSFLFRPFLMVLTIAQGKLNGINILPNSIKKYKNVILLNCNYPKKPAYTGFFIDSRGNKILINARSGALTAVSPK